MDGLWRFLDNHGVLEGLGVAFIVIVLLAIILWRVGVLKLENPITRTLEFVGGCPDPECKDQICEKLGTLESHVTSLIGQVGGLNGRLDVVIQWIKQGKL
jgi:hypothetical protein